MRDEESGAGIAVEVGEIRDRNVDRKTGEAGQCREADFGLQLVATFVENALGEVAGEFHE